MLTLASCDGMSRLASAGSVCLDTTLCCMIIELLELLWDFIGRLGIPVDLEMNIEYTSNT